MACDEFEQSLSVLPETGCIRVDLGAIAANYQLLQRQVAPGTCGAVVKADAYGLGMAPVAERLYQQGCRHFFVATGTEGAALRSVIPDAAVHIFVFNGVIAGAEHGYRKHGLTPVLNSLDQIAVWSRYAQRIGETLAAIINIDTGMLRLGLNTGDVHRLRAQPMMLKHLDIAYCMTHLACADDRNHSANREQAGLFEELRCLLPPAKTTIGNSAGIFLGREFHGDLVRPGIALYGGNPMQHEMPAGLREVVQLQARVLHVQEIECPGRVGYGGIHQVSPPARLATIAVGYADGYPRALSNCGVGMMGGRRFSVVGRVSMDLCTLEISNTAEGEIQPGMMVSLLGGGIDLETVAKAAGTVSYEILTGLGRRLRREYIG